MTTQDCDEIHRSASQTLGIATYCDRTTEIHQDNLPDTVAREYDGIFKYLPTPAIIISLPEGRIQEVNDIWQQEFGYLHEEASGVTIQQLKIYAESAQRNKMLRVIGDEGIRYSCECAFRHRDGRIVPYLSTLVGIKYSGRLCALLLLQDITVRKELEHMQVENSTKFRVLFESSRDAIGVFKAGIHEYVNPAYLELFGYQSSAQLDGCPFSNLIAPRDRAQVNQLLRLHYEGQEAPDLYEIHGLHQDGFEFDMEVKISSFELDGQHFILGLIRDITTRKQAETALLESERSYAALFEQSPVICEVFDKHGLLIAVNAAWERLWEIPREACLGRYNILQCQQLIAKGWLPHLQSVFAGKEAVAPAVEYNPALDPETAGKGRHRWITTIAYPIKNSKGEVSNVVIMHEDVTERFEAEQKAKLLSDMLDDAPASVLIHDFAGNILYANRHAAHLHGYSSKEFIHIMLPDLVIDQDRLLMLMNFQKLEAEGDASFEINHQRKNGSLLPLQVHARSVEWQGKPAILSVQTDLSEHQQVESILRESIESARRTMGATVAALSLALEKRDLYTAGHQQRVALIATAIARVLHLPEATIETIKIAGMLHDIGKIYIPTDILAKPAHLSEPEMNLVRCHPEVGHAILKNVPFDGPVATAVFQHHERLDGSGYPQGLRSEDIILEARILAVADVVEAVSSHRPYRPALGEASACDEIRQGSGTLYDPQVVVACLEAFASREIPKLLNMKH
jgi:PAS domain S-box-containing protein